MKIQIPHLNYIVYVKDGYHNEFGNLPSCERLDFSSCCIHMPKKMRNQATTVAHEVVHAVQFIAEARHINMVLEQEHIAYMVQYIMAKIMGVQLMTVKK